MTSVTLCLSGRPFRRRAVLDPSRTACPGTRRDRKSTRLNSSHSQISYAVFCLKKKKHTIRLQLPPTLRVRASLSVMRHRLFSSRYVMLIRPSSVRTVGHLIPLYDVLTVTVQLY